MYSINANGMAATDRKKNEATLSTTSTSCGQAALNDRFAGINLKKVTRDTISQQSTATIRYNTHLLCSKEPIPHGLNHASSGREATKMPTAGVGIPEK